MLHRAWWFGLLLSLLRTREECLCFLAAVWHLGQHQQEETGAYVRMVTSSLYSSSRFAYVRQFSSHLCKYIRMSCMCTCCYTNDLRAHTSTASVHIQPTSVLFSSGHWTAMSCSLAIDSRNQLQRGKNLFPLPTEM